MTSTAPARRIGSDNFRSSGKLFSVPALCELIDRGTATPTQHRVAPRGECVECRWSEVEARADGISLSSPGNQLMAVKATLDIRS
jgi:hypothetical protein